VGAHQLEVADAQGDGVHGELAGEMLVAHRGARGGGSGEGRGGHGGPFGRRVLAPVSPALFDFSIITSEHWCGVRHRGPWSRAARRPDSPVGRPVRRCPYRAASSCARASTAARETALVATSRITLAIASAQSSIRRYPSGESAWAANSRVC